MKELKKQVKVGHMTLAKTLAFLMRQPATPQDISAYTGVHLVTAQEWMRALRKERTVHISAWEPDTRGRDMTPVYTLGVGVDAKRRRKPQAQVAAEYRARKKMREMSHALVNATPVTTHNKGVTNGQ